MGYSGPLRSELKFRILQSLLNGEKKLGEIKADVRARETTILHVIKDFEALKMTAKSAGTYKLTSVGMMEAELSREYYSAVQVIENFTDFWLSHDVSGIPPPLVLRIGALKDATLIKADASELDKVHENFTRLLLSSKTLKGISPIFHPDYVQVFKTLLSKDVPVQLILTSRVFAKTVSSAEIGLMKRYMQEGKLKIFINNSIRVALTVTESCFSLGLFELNGEYDYNADLVSLGQEAISWGETYFENTLGGSVMVSVESLGTGQ